MYKLQITADIHSAKLNGDFEASFDSDTDDDEHDDAADYCLP